VRQAANAMTVIATVIDQHIEEAALLWLRRVRAAGEPHFRLDDLAKLDSQLGAHLDGMLIAEADAPNSAWQACEPELEWKDPGEVFPAAVLAWESGKATRVRRVMKTAAKSYESSRALVSALGWLTDEQAEPYINRLLGHAKAFERRVGIVACAVRGRDPGEAIERAVGSRDRLLKARALRAIGELARRDLLPEARQALRAKDEQTRFAAAWSVARLTHDEPALQVLKKTVELHSPDHSRALQLVLRRLPPSEAAAWINTLAQNPDLLRSAVIGTGIVGVPEAIPWLLELMKMPALARVAGEAFTMITGVDLAAEKLDGSWPEGFAAGPTEDPADDNVAMDADENLPWPDVAKLTAWWERRRGEFAAGTRYLCGRPLTEDWLEDVLRQGYQRQRAAAALELALLRPELPLFNVRAPGQRQQELLGLR
jgi:uncharacterized protein (TIGR02270 family)